VSGTDTAGMRAEAVERLEAVLDREVSMEPLKALALAVHGRSAQQIELGKIAIGFDSSVFLRMATHQKSVDILDYLPRHEAPLVLPGQAIQEYWNNHLSVMQTVSDSIKTSFNNLSRDTRKVDAQFGEFEQQVQEMLSGFEVQFGYIFDGSAMDKLSQMLGILQEQAYCGFAPRGRFAHIARIRKQTKTPPGYKDDGDGDFYLWADFLLGLLMLKSAGKNFEQVVMVTNEKKPDWSTRGTPHPILTAEVTTLFEVPFDLWNLDTFVSHVQHAIDG
jgi:PIN like domain